MIRQGDVLLVKVKAVPKGATEVPRDNGRLVLAYGEATGHAHVIDSPKATLLTTADNERFLRLVTAAPVSHEEHAQIMIAPGIYRVFIQDEWADSQEVRRVVD